MLARISSIYFVSKEVKYHHTCKTAYVMKSKRSKERKEEQPTTQEKNQPSAALKEIERYVLDYVLDKKRAEKYVSVYERYKDYRNSHDGWCKPI